MEKKKLPIGYWVRKVDKLLTTGINDIQSVHGINRTAWQVLNLIHENTSISKHDMEEDLQAFAENDMLDATLDYLVKQGWITTETDKYSLTLSGNAFFSDCFSQQTHFRQKAMQNIAAADYDITVKTLQQIVENLTGK